MFRLFFALCVCLASSGISAEETLVATINTPNGWVVEMLVTQNRPACLRSGHKDAVLKMNAGGIPQTIQGCWYPQPGSDYGMLVFDWSRSSLLDAFTTAYPTDSIIRNPRMR